LNQNWYTILASSISVHVQYMYHQNLHFDNIPAWHGSASQQNVIFVLFNSDTDKSITVQE